MFCKKYIAACDINEKENSFVFYENFLLGICDKFKTLFVSAH